MWGSNGSLAGALVSIIATLIIVAIVAVAGRQFGGVVPPFPDAADGSVATCVDEAVRPIGRAAISGRARLCLSRAGIQTTVDLENLSDAVTYTAWLGYFGEPARCSSSPCGDSDPVLEGATGLFERIDSAMPDLARRASLARGFRELHLRPGSEVQILVFQHGVLGRMNPSDRVRLLVAWPVTPTGHVVDTVDDRRISEPAVGRAVIRLLESPETSDAIPPLSGIATDAIRAVQSGASTSNDHNGRTGAPGPA
jgi:hypothetical protein